MKLAEKYNQANLLTSLIVLTITGIIYYVAIHFILTEKMDRDLVIEEREIEAYVKNYHRLPSPGDFLHQKVEYELLKEGQSIERDFYYSEFYNEEEKELEPGRNLATTITLDKKNYLVTISKSRAESEGLVRIIFLITIGVTILLLVSLLLINRLVLNRIWQPFYQTLNRMKAFNLAQKEDMRSNNTKIDEFNELNTAVATMAERVKKDYRELKTFTDNASHEMMTPLAVINAKLDLLLQESPLDSKQGVLIEEIYHAVSRLSRLSSSLLLLAKIENKLVTEQESLNLKHFIEEKAIHFQELMQNKGIKYSQQLQPKEINMSKYLLDILLNNLFSNAIRHNYQGGNIHIDLSENKLVISNTGNENGLDDQQVFERFYKNPASEGMGLGLAIVKQIINLQNFQISYVYRNNLHTFTLLF